jgi:hypothetical protein
MTESEQAVLADARTAMVAFRKTFGCELRLENLAEVYVASHLGLTLVHGNNPGFDAQAPTGERYQIKYRAKGNVIDFNSFNFDYLALVTVNDVYDLTGIYRITRQQAEGASKHREGVGYRREQISYAKFMAIAERVL